MRTHLCLVSVRIDYENLAHIVPLVNFRGMYAFVPASPMGLLLAPERGRPRGLEEIATTGPLRALSPASEPWDLHPYELNSSGLFCYNIIIPAPSPFAVSGERIAPYNHMKSMKSSS